MRHLTNSQFWDAYERLPLKVQKLAQKNFKILKSDPNHPSLQLKKVGHYWSARVGKGHRALAVEYAGNLVWFWVGTHAGYDRLLSQN